MKSWFGLNGPERKQREQGSEISLSCKSTYSKYIHPVHLKNPDDEHPNLTADCSLCC